MGQACLAQQGPSNAPLPISLTWLGVVAHTYNSTIREAEAGGLRI
jgi:hypothetical protein